MELQSITQIFQKLHQILAGLPVSLISVKIPFAEDHKAIVSVKIEQRVFVLAFQIHKLAAQHRLDRAHLISRQLQQHVARNQVVVSVGKIFAKLTNQLRSCNCPS